MALPGPWSSSCEYPLFVPWHRGFSDRVRIWAPPPCSCVGAGGRWVGRWAWGGLAARGTRHPMGTRLTAWGSVRRVLSCPPPRDSKFPCVPAHLAGGLLVGGWVASRSPEVRFRPPHLRLDNTRVLLGCVLEGVGVVGGFYGLRLTPQEVAPFPALGAFRWRPLDPRASVALRAGDAGRAGALPSTGPPTAPTQLTRRWFAACVRDRSCVRDRLAFCPPCEIPGAEKAARMLPSPPWTSRSSSPLPRLVW
jgi:hypothetical protein